MDSNFNESPFAKPFCYTCLEVNTELLSDDDVLAEFKELLHGQVPPFLQTIAVQFCFNCSMQMKRMKNFKATARTNLDTIERVMKRRQEIKKKIELVNNNNDKKTQEKPQQPQAAPVPEIKRYAVYERVQTRSRGRKDSLDLTRNLAKIKQNVPKKRTWRENYDKILKNQPVVALKAIAMEPLPTLRRITPTKASLKDHSTQQIVIADDDDDESPPDLYPNNSVDAGNDPPTNPDSYCSICQIHVELRIMTKHIVMFHFSKPAPNSFQCSVCSKGFKSVSGAVKHFQLHRQYENPKECEECLERFTQVQQFKQHFAAFHAKKWTCDYCGEKYSRKLDWQKHILARHPENVQCLECREILDSKTTYFTHILQHKKYPTMWNSAGTSGNGMTTPPLLIYSNEEPNFAGFQNNMNADAGCLLSEDELENFSIPLFGNIDDPLTLSQ